MGSTAAGEGPRTAESRPRRRGPARATVLSMLVVVVLAAVGTVLALPLVSATGDVGPGRVSLSLGWDRRGDTELSVPPLGKVLVDTHRAPTAVRARIESIDVVEAQRFARARPTEDALVDRTRDDVGALVRDLLWRLALVSAAVGAVVGLVVARRRRVRAAVVGTAAALVTAAVLSLWTWWSFDTAAFATPRYEGALTYAPAVLDGVRREFGNLAGVEDRLSVLSGQVGELFAVAADPEAGLDDTMKILHVSDVHSNPLGLEIARELAERFEVEAVVDTGDFTSFGQPVETTIAVLVARFPAPYYLVPGNHDSPENRRSLAAAENLTVLDGDVVDVDGVRILGFADPAYTAGDGDTDEAARVVREAQAPRVAARVEAEQPDVLAVANLRQARGAFGEVPLVIAGDVHRRTERVVDGTRVLTVGSIGATGLGSFTIDPALPYEAQVLHFRAGRLVALDYVTLSGVSGSFEVSRTVDESPSRR